ncbi:MAG: threonine--tRNA ligase [Bdellovibrionales bacterium]|nr:threonine--tRNA ligase [Bdellovibrionales bacterium]
MSVSIRLADSSVKEFDKEPSVLELAQSISSDLAEKTLGAFINSQEEIVDVRTILKDQDQVDLITSSSPASLEVIRHSAAHVLAQAVQELRPETKVTIGPVIENGFYYDFDVSRPFTDEDMLVIENKMKEILSRKLSLVKEIWPAEKAIKAFQEMGESYKVEIIKELGESSVSVYKQGDWFDLCRGPHCQHLGQIGAVKILSHSACYWRADENNQALQRIYGTAFHTQKELDDYLKLMEQVKKRDHRKIGKEMNLFYFNEGTAGQPFFKKSGAVIYRQLQNFLREKYEKYGYEEVISPQIYSKDVFVRSGHFDFYKGNMYSIEGENPSFLKPMNCPGHCLLYKSSKWSYKNLPWRVADFGRLHRRERSGVLHGLIRVLGFCQDDAHIFCSMSQLRDEIESFIQMFQDIYSSLGLTNYQLDLCTRPAQRMGEDQIWDKAEESLSLALKNMKTSFHVSQGDGAFYGPKIDIMFEDSLKRKWQLGTLQCDFNLPKVFNLSFSTKENTIEQPVLLHRAILGSMERFIGIYTEHLSGWFPTWLAPVQVVLMNVSQDQEEYINSLYEKFSSVKNLRVQKDINSESLSYKIRQARNLRIPYMVIVGKKEMESNKISVRSGAGPTAQIEVDTFLSNLEKEIIERKVGYSSF